MLKYDVFVVFQNNEQDLFFISHPLSQDKCTIAVFSEIYENIKFNLKGIII